MGALGPPEGEEEEEEEEEVQVCVSCEELQLHAAAGELCAGAMLLAELQLEPKPTRRGLRAFACVRLEVRTILFCRTYQVRYIVSNLPSRLYHVERTKSIVSCCIQQEQEGG
eukprot:307738-Prorocentrum_minimum.AAC.3